MQWEVEILPIKESYDHRARQVVRDAAALGITPHFKVQTGRAYLMRGSITAEQVQRVAVELLADPVVETVNIMQLNGHTIATGPEAEPSRLINVLYKRGVTDPVASSAMRAINQMRIPVHEVRTLRKYWVQGATDEQIERLCAKVLANDSIEQVVWGPLAASEEIAAPAYQFQLRTIRLSSADAETLVNISRDGHLFLTLPEMQQIQSHFCSLGREPTDVELETIAQTWSEHCSHKTLKGRIEYEDEHGQRLFENLLKETVFAATQKVRETLGMDDWCISVFEDNAGVVTFDEEDHVVFKVETHNHPSAIEPYGGANTGLGGVIRDPLGTGLGARPICNTDVFCFAPLDTPADQVPEGVLHPRRVFTGVVAGVRDYGNRMGIPTVNGAIFFDPRYLANPLVYCGNVGLLPVDKVIKHAQTGDLVVVMGGRTGRDGIHGATFSSAELTSDSEEVSGGAVQIGNAITEKMLLDVLLQARDRGLFRAVTDCGAGGLSSAVGEMGCDLGAAVALDRVPLKYAGLSYAEIWISEAQERMVLAVPPTKWEALRALCDAEDVEATAIGSFTGTGRLQLTYDGHPVADIDMQFLHEGRPPIVRQARYQPAEPRPAARDASRPTASHHGDVLKKILASPNVASKEWVIRQYDHEVQGGSVIKPLVGVTNDGPSDAAVVRPKLHTWRGLVIACGMNPRYGDFDTYHMAASAIDEAIRNCVAVGADPSRIAILDNFCWGNVDRPETLGSLVRAALACYEVAVALETPFISGKDSLHNEFSFSGRTGRETISIPPSLLISALGQIDDVRRCVTMDLKEAGNLLFAVGNTADELRGSHYELVTGYAWGTVPHVHPATARATFTAVHRAIQQGLVRACHDMSEGGLAAALAEMALAGGWGASIALANLPHELADDPLRVPTLLFAESNSRFICEVTTGHADAFAALFEQAHLPCATIGRVISQPHLQIREPGSTRLIVDESCTELKAAWQTGLGN